MQINCDDDQIDDRVDEAIQFYQEYHSDAIIKMYRKHKITQTNLTNKYIDLPDAMMYVSRVFPLGNNSSASGGLWSARYQMMLNDVYDLQKAGGIANYVQTRQYIEMLDMMLNGTPPVRFNRHMNRLFLDVDWGVNLRVDDWIIVDGYTTLDPDEYEEIYNDMFLKKYTTALIKKQWGENLKKFQGVTMPGGVTLNGQQIWDEAVAEITLLETEMQEKHEFPPDMMIG